MITTAHAILENGKWHEALIGWEGLAAKHGAVPRFRCAEWRQAVRLAARIEAAGLTLVIQDQAQTGSIYGEICDMTGRRFAVRIADHGVCGGRRGASRVCTTVRNLRRAGFSIA